MPEIDDPKYVKAMSHPLRVRIMAMLGERAASPVELAPRLGVSLSLTSYHVRTLHRLGLVELVSTTPVRGAIAHHYRAKDRPRVTDEAWAKAPPVAKQAAVGSTLQVIDEYARLSAGAGGFDRPEAHLSRTSVDLDAQGWRELADACTAFVTRVEELEREARARQEGSEDAGLGRAAVALMAFESARLSDAPADEVAALRPHGDDPGGERAR